MGTGSMSESSAVRVSSRHNERVSETSLPLKIVGSRLQALSLLTIAVTILVAQSGKLLPWALPLALVFFILVAVIGVRLATLSVDGVSIRRITGTRQASIGDFEAYADHRHLRLTFANGGRARIEVPVEIRPQVRDWAEAASIAYTGTATNSAARTAADTGSHSASTPASDPRQ